MLLSQIGFAVNSMSLCGALAGQIFFGVLGDRFGRKPSYTASLAILILGAVGSSMSFGSTRSQVIGTLCWWRFWLGFGIGGCYPLTSVLMSEYSATKSRGKYISAVFCEFSYRLHGPSDCHEIRFPQCRSYARIRVHCGEPGYHGRFLHLPRRPWCPRKCGQGSSFLLRPWKVSQPDRRTCPSTP